MKRNKMAMVALLVTATLITLFSFENKRSHRPVSLVTFYYTGDHKFIGCSDPNSLIESEVKDVSNWTTTAPADPCDNGDYLCSITFDLEFVADGGGDGKLTLQEAINALWVYYVSHNCTLPAHGNCFAVENATVCIARRSTND